MTDKRSPGKLNAAYLADDHGQNLQDHGFKLNDSGPVYQNETRPALPTKKQRPQNLNIPPQVSAKSRPLSSAHNYEELPYATNNKARLTSISESTDNIYVSVPSPPPVSSLPSIASSRNTLNSNYDSRIGSQFGSDVTIFRDGPRKRENPLYDVSQKSASEYIEHDQKDSSSCASCMHGQIRVICICLVIVFLLILLLLLLVILLFTGTVSTSSTPKAINENVGPSFEAQQALQTLNQTTEQLQRANETIAILQNKVEYLEYKMLRLDLGSNSSIQEVVANNTAILHEVEANLKVYMQKAETALLLANKYNNNLQQRIFELLKRMNTFEETVRTINSEMNALKVTTAKTTADLTYLQTDLMGLTKCEYNSTGQTAYSQPKEIISGYFPPSIDFYQTMVVMSVQCSADNGDTGGPTAVPFFDNSPHHQWHCKCTAKSSSLATRIDCRIHAISCAIAL
ncbi:uncharacterized protein LOC141903544 [Tubulanus polymorphus]|uniref:uncharacterized protein LOC141903544 n=1 Tax=Tubulanus polymorphus TaxID=672921 RepID=UPI003DA3C68C